MYKIIKATLFFAIGFFCFKGVSQQRIYSLNECVDIAIKNNLELRGSNLKTESSKVELDRSWGDIMPSVNASYNLGVSNGRSIDPYTNAYINQNLTFSNSGLNLSATVFNGFKLKNSIKQSRLNLKASEMEEEEARQDLRLKVTLLYLQILNARDQLVLAQARQDVTDQQVKRLQTLFKEEVGNPADYTDMKGQLSADNMAVINAENNRKEAVINLFLTLGVDTDIKADFENFDKGISFEHYPLSSEEIYLESLQNLPTFKAKELRKDAAQSGVSIAKAEYTPEISVFGTLNTNYSSAAQLFEQTGTTLIQTGDFVDINGQQFNVMSDQPSFESNKISYQDQFNNNLYSSYGVSVNIPLFNGFRVRNNVRLNKIQLEESEVELLQTKLSYKKAIEQAYNNMEASFERYNVLQQQVEAYEESFRINEIRFNSGVSNIVEYIVAKNNMDSARLNLSLAKYEYVLRVKILDYYRGVN